jgi:hypothetical protein
MLRVPDSVRNGIRFAIPQATERQRLGDQIDAAFIFARGALRECARGKWPPRVRIVEEE